MINLPQVWKERICVVIGKNSITGTEINMSENFRNELPVLRAKARISQADIAKKIGVSRQTYCSIENGTRKMTQTILLALVAYFQNNESTKEMLGNMKDLFEDTLNHENETTE